MGLDWEIFTNSRMINKDSGNFIQMGWNPLIWRELVVSTSKQYIHCVLENLSGLILNITTVYESYRKGKRTVLWNEIEEIKSQVGSEPWGDFNHIRYQAEREGRGVFDF